MNYLLEIGVEEIPAGFLPEGRRELEERARQILAEEGENFARRIQYTICSTPRRLALLLGNLEERSDDRVEKHKGPPAKAAYDAAGKPTKAAEGFAKKVGATVDALEREGEYVVARVSVPGRAVEQILADAAPRILEALQWPKSMRWNEGGKRFVRPVRWIVSLLEDHELRVAWAGISSSRISRLRRCAPGSVSREVVIPTASLYAETLAKEGVIVEHAKRAEFIRMGAEKCAREASGQILYIHNEMYVFLADLVEDPCVIIGEFDPSLASIPGEVLELTMWRHQKYIPLHRMNGAPMPKFLITANRTFGPAKDPLQFEANVKAGNRRVLSARLSDAQYFWTTDLKRPLMDRVEDLGRVMYQKDAGSVLDRVNRIGLTAARIAPLLGISDLDAVRRAARLAKADLTTKMVFEFPELQGVIGRRLAEAQGERPEIAQAIEEHYWPLGADPRIPRGLSAVIALADKADTLETIFRVGLEPTGSADPFGLRRAAIGVIRILLAHGQPFDVTTLFGSPKVLDFVRGRMLHYFADQLATSVNVIDAVASVGWTDLPSLQRRAAAAAKLPQRPDYEHLTISFKRVMNILDETGDSACDPALLAEPAERDLGDAVRALDADVAKRLAAGDVDGALSVMAAIRPAVDRFFDDVLVNAEDPALRRNRKALLRSLGAIFLRVLDFSRL